MYAIHLNNSPLDLGKATLSLTMVNPIFDPESINRVFSYPQTIPATPLNKHLLKHADRIDTKTGNAKYEAKLYLDHVLFEIGVVIITGSTDKNFTIVFKSYSLEVIEELKTINLKTDLSFPKSIGYNFCPSYQLRSNFVAPFTDYLSIEVNGKLYSGLRVFSGIVQQINADLPGTAELISSDLFHYEMRLTCNDPLVPLIINVNPIVSNTADHSFFELIPLTVAGDDSAVSPKLEIAWSTYLVDILTSPIDHVFPTVFTTNFYV